MRAARLDTSMYAADDEASFSSMYYDLFTPGEERSCEFSGPALLNELCAEGVAADRGEQLFSWVQTAGFLIIVLTRQLFKVRTGGHWFYNDAGSPHYISAGTPVLLTLFTQVSSRCELDEEAWGGSFWSSAHFWCAGETTLLTGATSNSS